MMFCLDDGAELLYGPASGDEPATAVLGYGESATRSYGRTTADEAERQSLSAHRAAEPQRSTGHWLLIAVGVAILLSVGAFFGYRYFVSATSSQISSIAVMPFVNGSSFPEDEYLSDGMTETLIRTLSQLPNLNVKSRSSVFRYKGKDADARTIAKELGVGAILNGRLVQRGDGLLLNLELIDAETENVLWAEQYDRKSSDLVSLQNDIARDVLSKLRSRLSGEDQVKLAKTYTTNPEAYKLYLQGRFYWDKRDEASFRKAIDYFNRAITIDPNYALAYAGLADCYALMSTFGFLPQPEGMPKAQEHARRALSLDESLAEPHTALAVALQSYEYNFPEAEREYRRAIELNPNYLTGHQWYGELLVCAGRFDEAAASYRRALEIDPLSLPANWEYARSFYYARKFDESIEAHKRLLEIDPKFQGTYRTLGEAYRVKGDFANAAETQAKFFELAGESRHAELVRKAYSTQGWNGVLRLITAEGSPLKFRHAVIARAFVELGDKDKAFAELEKGYQLREAPLQWLKVEPQFDPLRDDPRFEELMRRMHFSE